MTKNLPEIRIQDAWLFRQQISTRLLTNSHNLIEIKNDEYYEERVKSYRKAWNPYETKILTAMTGIVGTDFAQSHIDVYIAPGVGAISVPMLIGVDRVPDEFLDTLTHELLHRLFTDNTSQSKLENLAEAWIDMFGEEHSFTTLVHIPVLSVHKEIFIDVLDEKSRSTRQLKRYKRLNAQEYLKAVDYVEKIGYKKINAQLKEIFSK